MLHQWVSFNSGNQSFNVHEFYIKENQINGDVPPFYVTLQSLLHAIPQQHCSNGIFKTQAMVDRWWRLCMQQMHKSVELSRKLDQI